MNKNLTYLMFWKELKKMDEIILIIDEAHHHATSEISKGLIEMIDQN